MLSASSPNAGSRVSSGKLWGVDEEVPWRDAVGVVVEARREVREGARRGVIGREGIALREVERLWGGAEVGVVDVMAEFWMAEEFAT